MAQMTDSAIRPACVKYNDPDFTDLEVDVIMEYFGISRYEKLGHALREMKIRHLEAC